MHGDFLTRFPQVKRMVTTAAAVAAGVGLVLALQTGIRTLMRDGVTGSMRMGTPENVARPVAKTYDLGLVVPPKLRFAVGGLESRRESVLLPMPQAQAECESAAQAKAAGWRPYDPLERFPDCPKEYAADVRKVLKKSGLMQTPDGALVLRTFKSEAGGTRRDEISIDVNPVSEMKDVQDLGEVIARTGGWVEREVPALLRPLVAGGVLYSQLIERGGGCSYIVLMLRRGKPARVRADQDWALTAAGWIRQRRLDGAWVKGNLMAAFSYDDRAEAGGTLVSLRVSDDELVEDPERPDPTGVL